MAVQLFFEPLCKTIITEGGMDTCSRNKIKTTEKTRNEEERKRRRGMRKGETRGEKTRRGRMENEEGAERGEGQEDAT